MTAAMRILPINATLRRVAKKAFLAYALVRTRMSAYLNHARWMRVARHRRPIAIAMSVGLHVLLVLCLLPNGKFGFSTGGQGRVYEGEGEGLSVDLTALALINAQALEMRESEPETRTELDEMEALDDLATKAGTQALSNVLPDVPAEAQPEPERTDLSRPSPMEAVRQGGEGQGGTSSGGFDELWEAIAPCWRRIADEHALPVKLNVTFAGDGMLAKPPEIIRAAEDVSNPRALRSESLAITALAECGAYQMAAGRQNVSIYFPKP
jgi:hypothetical protein